MWGGTLTNTGAIHNYGQLNNDYGTLTNNAGASITTSATSLADPTLAYSGQSRTGLDNHRRQCPFGTVTNDASGTMNNYGEVLNYGHSRTQAR